QVISGTAAYIVKDPSSNQYFRFREIEGYIFQHLDGRTELEQLREKVEAEFGATLSISTLDQFLAKLGKLNLLQRVDHSAPVAAVPRSPVRGDIFYLRFKAFDPDALLGRLAGKLGFFFTSGFVGFSAAAISAAVVIAF